jgi:WD40 repeat protein
MSLAVAPGGTRMATTDSAGRVALWTLGAGTWSEELLDLDGFANTAEFSPDGRILGVGGTDITIWDLETAGGTLILRVPESGIEAMAFSPDGKTLAFTYEKTGDVILWDLVEQRQRERFVTHSSSNLSIAFSKDGQYLAVGGNGHIASITLWNLSSNACVLHLNGNFGPVRALEFSPDGTALATSGAYERCVRLWDRQSARLIRSFGGHEMGTNGLAFSPDGTLLATVGNDGTGRVWNVATGALQTIVDGETPAVPSVRFLPDGLTVATTRRCDNDVRLWDLKQHVGDYDSRERTLGRHIASMLPPVARGPASRLPIGIHNRF